jgi:hypothetical protein
MVIVFVWDFNFSTFYSMGHAVARLWHYATGQKAPGSIPDVNGIFQLA